MLTLVKGAIRRTVAQFGYEIRRRNRNEQPAASTPPVPEPIPAAPAAVPTPPPPPAPAVHGIGSMEEFLRFLHQLGFRPKCVLDVGANETRWSVLAAQVFPDARFVLIEPQDEMVPACTAFCATHPSARFIPAGAASRSGQAFQTIWDDLQGSSFLPGPDEELQRSGRQRVTPLITIDEEFAHEPHLPDLVKLDIQGYELEALKGADRLFGHTECFILEVSLFGGEGTVWPGVHDVVDFMHQRGYRVYDVCGFLRRPLDDALGQFDLAFVRSNGRLGRDRRWSSAEPAPTDL